MNRTCSVAICDMPISSGDLCFSHARRLRVTGDVRPDVPLQRNRSYPSGSTCSVAGCDSPVKATDLCNAHYQKNRTFGDPLACNIAPPNRHEANDDGSMTLVVTRLDGTEVRSVYDAADHVLVLGRKWYVSANGYVVTNYSLSEGKPNGSKLFLHLAMLGRANDKLARGDHIDGDPLNNRRSNLRVIPHSANISNQVNVNHRGASRYRNVQRDPSPRGGWIVVIQHHRKTRRRAGFATEEDAARGAVQLRRELGIPEGR